MLLSNSKRHQKWHFLYWQISQVKHRRLAQKLKLSLSVNQRISELRNRSQRLRLPAAHKSPRKGTLPKGDSVWFKLCDVELCWNYSNKYLLFFFRTASTYCTCTSSGRYTKYYWKYLSIVHREDFERNLTINNHPSKCWKLHFQEPKQVSGEWSMPP